MEKVTVPKGDLINLIQMNRDGHQAIFDEAVEGYRKAAEKLLERHLAAVKKGSLAAVFINLPRPVNHTKDYDRVLTMLKMSIGDTIEVTQEDFAMYAMDDWRWKQEFLRTNSEYSASAMAAFSGSE